MDAVRGTAGSANLPNPFLASTVSHLPDPEVEQPPIAAADEAWTLGNLYRRMVDIVTTSQAELERDQERLANLFARAQSAQPMDEFLDVQVFLMQEGIELRLRELDEECRRLAAVERRLRRSIDAAEADCEIEAIRTTGLSDPRLIEKMTDQRRVIRVQQEEMDHIIFERHVFADDAARMRESLENFQDGDSFGDEGLAVVTGAFVKDQQRQAAEQDEALQAVAKSQSRASIGGAADDTAAVTNQPRPKTGVQTVKAAAKGKSAGGNRLVKAKAKPKGGTTANATASQDAAAFIG